MFCSNVLLCLYRRSEWVTNSRLCYFVCVSCIIRLSIFCADRSVTCTNQQPPQRGGAVPDPVWAGSKWLLAFLRVPVTPGTPLHFSLCCPLNDRWRAAQHLQNRSPVFTFSSLLPYSCPSSSPHSSSSPDER